MNLSLLVIIPLLNALAILVCRNPKQVRVVSLIGTTLQLVISLILLVLFWKERSAGNFTPMLFQSDYTWISSLNIHFHMGVDGISISMILLTAIVVQAGTMVSWTMESMTKAFFFLLIFLSLGAYGFFISLDLFALFFFLEISVIPKYMLIGIWGSGKKEYSAMKLALMLMGGSALVFVGLLGLYFHTDTGGGRHTFDLLRISEMSIPVAVQKIFFPFIFTGFGF